MFDTLTELVRQLASAGSPYQNWFYGSFLAVMGAATAQIA